MSHCCCVDNHRYKEYIFSLVDFFRLLKKIENLLPKVLAILLKWCRLQSMLSCDRRFLGHSNMGRLLFPCLRRRPVVVFLLGFVGECWLLVCVKHCGEKTRAFLNCKRLKSRGKW